MINMLKALGKKQKLWVAWLLVAPVILIRGFTTLFPTVKIFINSFYEIKLLKNPNGKFIGFRNYINIFKDVKVLDSIEFTLIFTVSSVLFLVIIGTAFALLLNVKFKGKKFLRTIALIPWAMPMVVVGIAAKWGFNDTYGFINDLIRRLVPNFHLEWLTSINTAQISVILVDLWKNIPYFAILVLASLQFISDDIYEASKLDGASRMQTFISITLPGIRKTIMLLIIFFSIWRLTSYDIVYAMTSGGPANGTSLIAYRIMTEAFTNLNVGYAAAISMVLFLCMAFLSIINLMFIKKIDD